MYQNIMNCFFKGGVFIDSVVFFLKDDLWDYLDQYLGLPALLLQAWVKISRSLAGKTKNYSVNGFFFIFF